MVANWRLPLGQQIHCHDALYTGLNERNVRFGENIINFRYNNIAKRGNKMAMHSSPSSESSAVVLTEPLTKEDLVGYLASGCKPKEKWR